MKAIIAAVLNDEASTSIASSLKLEKIDRLPYHLTLYSLELLEDKKKELEKIVGNITNSSLPLTERITGIETTHYRIVRFSLENSSLLQELHERIVKECNNLRDKNVISKPKQFYHEFSKEEQKLIDLYGRPNVMQRFKPHITIGKTEGNIKRKIDINISINDLEIFYL